MERLLGIAVPVNGADVAVDGADVAVNGAAVAVDAAAVVVVESICSFNLSKLPVNSFLMNL